MGFHTPTVVALFAVVSVSCAPLGEATHPKEVSTPIRLVDIRRAQVWAPTDVPAMDITAGPQGKGAFKPNQTVTCDYVDKKNEEGRTPKFYCAVGPDDTVKVKYGFQNGEVYGEVAATRLLWALGFGADRMYPVRVICRGCPSALGAPFQLADGSLVFDVAAIERKMPGHEIDGPDVHGWGWPELDLVEPTAGGASRAERDALKLLAVVIQHTDSKPEQQRLVCLDEKEDAKTLSGTDSGRKAAEGCNHPFMMINDLGQTFGAANEYNRNHLGSVNIKRWSSARVWLDGDRCVGNLPRSLTGTLNNPEISEEGRAFLASLLTRLSDTQIRALFEVSRFPLRPVEGVPPAAESVDAWIGVFKDKIYQVVHRTCPSDPPHAT